MREAVGGSLLFYIMIGFIFIYIVFIAVIMNYAATYRASNYVITALEESEGEVNRTTLIESLQDRNYYNDLSITCSENSNGDAVYRVTTYVNFDVPLIDAHLRLAINNETKAIYGEPCKENATNGGV